MGDEAKSLKTAADAADKTFQSLKVSFTQATQRFREIKHKRDALQDEANVETPVGISTLQDALKVCVRPSPVLSRTELEKLVGSGRRKGSHQEAVR